MQKLASVLLVITSVVCLFKDNTKDVTKPRILSVYTLNGDLIHINVDRLIVMYESRDSVHTFDTWQDMNEFVEDVTVKGCIPSGYANDIQYYIDQGFITAEVHPSIDKNGDVLSPVGRVELWYNGPNWTIDSSADTMYQMVTFPFTEGFDAEYDTFLNRTYRMHVAYGLY